jgi:hypothetical protein
MQPPAQLHSITPPNPSPPQKAPGLPPLGVIVTVVASGAAGIASFFGLRAMLAGSGAEGVVIPLVATAAISLGLFGIWHITLTIALNARDVITRVLVVAMGIVVGIVAIGASAWFVAVAIGGSSALEAHMAAGLDSYRRGLTDARASLLTEEPLVAEAMTAAAEMRALAMSERSGAVSGRTGDGPLAKKLDQVAESFDNTAATMRATQERGADLYAQGLQLVENATRTIGADDPARERQTRLAMTLAQLGDLIAQISTLTATETARQVGIVVVEPVGVSATQKQAYRSAANQAAEITDRLAATAARIKATRPTVQVPAWQPMAPGTAVVEYGASVPGAWVVGVSVDTFPLLLLLLLLLAPAGTLTPSQH